MKTLPGIHVAAAILALAFDTNARCDRYPRFDASIISQGDLAVSTGDGSDVSTWKFFGLRSKAGTITSVSDGTTTNVAVHRVPNSICEGYLNFKSTIAPQFSDRKSDGVFHHSIEPCKPSDFFLVMVSGKAGLVEKKVCDVSSPPSTTRQTQFSGPVTPLDPPNTSMRMIVDAAFDGDAMRQYYLGAFVDDTQVLRKYVYTMDGHTTVGDKLLPTTIISISNIKGYGLENTSTMVLKNITYSGLPDSHDFEATVKTFTRDLRRFNKDTKDGLGDFVTPRAPRFFIKYWLAAAALGSYFMFRRWRMGAALVRT